MSESQVALDTRESLEKFSAFSVDRLLKADLPPAEWIVEGLIPDKGMTLLDAKPGDFKSYLSIHLSLCVATGEPFLERKVKQGKVLYIDEENDIDLLRERFEKLRNAFSHVFEERRRKQGLEYKSKTQGKPLQKIWIMSFKNVKMNSQGQKEIEKIMKELNPSIVIVDSLVRVMEGDENSTRDAKAIFNTIKDLSRKYGCSFLFLHHTRKYDQKRKNAKLTIDDVRGSGDFVAAASSVLILNRLKDDTFQLTQGKSRGTRKKSNDIGFKVEDRLCFDTREGLFIEIMEELEKFTKAESLAHEIKEYFYKNKIKLFQPKEIYEAFEDYPQRTVRRAFEEELVSLGVVKKGKEQGVYEVLPQHKF